MSAAISKEQTANLEETVISNAYQIAAMFNLLERKGLLSRQEVVEEVKRIKEDMHKMIEVYK